VPADSPLLPPRPASQPVELIPVGRSHRAVLGNLGQLYRHDLSGPYGLVPNLDGTFNNRRLDLFLAEADPAVGAWLIMAAGSLGGFVMTAPADGGGRSISDFFIVRALRRCGVGREAACQVIAMTPGPWRIAFQAYNPGAQRFWSQVASDAVGDQWAMHDDPSGLQDTWKVDTWVTFQT
jgi:predicted acetyltransferase